MEDSSFITRLIIHLLRRSPFFSSSLSFVGFSLSLLAASPSLAFVSSSLSSASSSGLPCAHLRMRAGLSRWVTLSLIRVRSGQAVCPDQESDLSEQVRASRASRHRTLLLTSSSPLPPGTQTVAARQPQQTQTAPQVNSIARSPKGGRVAVETRVWLNVWSPQGIAGLPCAGGTAKGQH